MSVAPGDPSLDLFPQQRTRGFNLFACCMPKKEEVPKAPVADNDADKDRAFDLPELVDEDPIASPAPTTDNNYLIVSFLQIIFAFLLFNFNNEPNAIKADAEPKKKTVPIATNDTDGDLKVEEVPEIAAVQ